MLEARTLIFVLTIPFFYGVLMITDRLITTRYGHNRISFAGSLILAAGFIIIEIPVLFISGTHNEVTFIACYTALFSVIAIMDWRYKIISNVLLLIVLFFLIAQLVIGGHFPIERILTAAGTFILLTYIRYVVFKHKGKVVIGYGDIKLLFLIAIMTSTVVFAAIIWIASLTGLLYTIAKKIVTGSSMNETIPLGTYLSAALIVFLLTPLSENMFLNIV